MNCAYTSPLLRTAAQAGQEAIRAKQNPWDITSEDFFNGIENVRRLFSCIIESEPDCVAIVPAVSYGIALAAKNIPVAKNQQIVVLQDQFPSNIYTWQRLADTNNAALKTVRRPADSDWTGALTEAIEDSVSIVAIPNCHWTDGTLIDLVKIGEKCRSSGAALVIDGTQSLGAMSFSIEEVQPDFLVTTAHKWLLGPYSFGFCYVDPKWHNGIPLEESWLNRSGSENFAQLVNYRNDYQIGARRYDMGEVSNFILTPIAASALEQLLDWGVENIAKTLQLKTDAIAGHANQMGLYVSPKNMRAPHMIGVAKPGGFNDDLPSLLAREKIFVSVRGESVRISPHLYNTAEEIERLFSALQKTI